MCSVIKDSFNIHMRILFPAINAEDFIKYYYKDRFYTDIFFLDSQID